MIVQVMRNAGVKTLAQNQDKIGRWDRNIIIQKKIAVLAERAQKVLFKRNSRNDI